MKMDRTEGSAPQLARKGEFHTRSVFHMRFSAYFTRKAHFTWVYRRAINPNLNHDPFLTSLFLPYS